MLIKRAVPEMKNINSYNIIFEKITITIRYLIMNKNGTVNEKLSKTVNIRTKKNKIGFCSLVNAVRALNRFINTHNIKYISYIDIIFGNGTTFVMPKNKRKLDDIGNAYSNKILAIDIGRKETYIGRLGIFGVGQGTSTIRGSWTANVYNLGKLPIIKDLNTLYTEDTLQYDNRLIINNLFWVGRIAINVYYPTDINDPVIAPIYEKPEDIFNKNKNTYLVKEDTTQEEISNWVITRSPEVEIINVWIELADPPEKTTEPGKGTKLIHPPPELKEPLFFINTPSISRFFMVQSNIMTYIIPNFNIPVSYFSTQFLNPNILDTFIQDCSFSTRAFGGVNPDFTCCEFYNHGKVSILNSQFNGRLLCQSDKLALFGCYLLGVGVSDTEQNKEPNTTPALNFIPPTGKAALLAGYPKRDARFIQSSCEWVCYINNWSVADKNNPCNTIKKYSKENENKKFDIEQKILPWRFTYKDNKWGKDNKILPAIFFNQSSFYMVDPNVKGDFNKGFSFDCIDLTNTNKCQLSFEQLPILEGREKN